MGIGNDMGSYMSQCYAHLACAIHSPRPGIAAVKVMSHAVSGSCLPVLAQTNFWLVIRQKSGSSEALNRMGLKLCCVVRAVFADILSTLTTRGASRGSSENLGAPCLLASMMRAF